MISILQGTLDEVIADEYGVSLFTGSLVVILYDDCVTFNYSARNLCCPAPNY